MRRETMSSHVTKTRNWIPTNLKTSCMMTLVAKDSCQGARALWTRNLSPRREGGQFLLIYNLFQMDSSGGGECDSFGGKC